jgi:hypothetical protein
VDHDLARVDARAWARDGTKTSPHASSAVIFLNIDSVPVLVHIAEDRTGWKRAQAAKDGRGRLSQIVASETDR